MKNDVLEDIKSYAVKKLTAAYGYCGLADYDDWTFIRSGDNDVSIQIKIETETEE